MAYYLAFDGVLSAVGDDMVSLSPSLVLNAGDTLEYTYVLESAPETQWFIIASSNNANVIMSADGGLILRNDIYDLEIDGVSLVNGDFYPFVYDDTIRTIKLTFKIGNRNIVTFGNASDGRRPAPHRLYSVIKKTSEGTILNNYNPSSSNGTGSILPDDIGGNDGTLVNFPTDDSQWVFYSEPSAGVDATGAITLPKFTVSSSANATLPQPEINGAFSLPLLTVNGTASAELPQPTASGAFSIPKLTVLSSASATLPQPEIAGAFSFPLLSVDGASSATLPQPIIQGEFSLTKLSVSGSASAELPQPVITGSFSFPILNISGTANATTTENLAFGAFSLPSLLVSASAIATLPQPSIEGAFSLPKLSVSGSVTSVLPQPVISGNIAAPSLTVSASGTVTLPQPEIVGAFSIPTPVFKGFATISGLVLVIERGTNINQKYLSANINQKYLSNTIIYN